MKRILSSDWLPSALVPLEKVLLLTLLYILY